MQATNYVLITSFCSQKQILLVSNVLIIYCLLCATEKSYQQLGLRVSSGYPNTSKQWKHSATAVSRCFDTLMKHLPLLLTYYKKYWNVHFILWITGHAWRSTAVRAWFSGLNFLQVFKACKLFFAVSTTSRIFVNMFLFLIVLGKW